MKVRFLVPAEIEMFEVAAFYEMQASALGGNFLDIVEEAIIEIEKYPEACQELGKGVRRMVVRRFPFSILYQIFNNEIIVVAIMHQKQKPRYWIDRL